MEQVSMIGIDLAKNSFQLHGARPDGSVAFRKKLSRAKVLGFLASQPRCTVAMEACGGAHHWGREIGRLGHAVRLVPPVPVPRIPGLPEAAHANLAAPAPGLGEHGAALLAEHGYDDAAISSMRASGALAGPPPADAAA